jgi:hypothetical protein
MTNYSNEFGMRDYAESLARRYPGAAAGAGGREGAIYKAIVESAVREAGLSMRQPTRAGYDGESRHCARQNNPPAASFDAGPGYSAQPSRPARAEGKPWEKVIAKVCREAGLSMRRPTGAGYDGGSPYSARQNNPPAASFDAGPGYSAQPSRPARAEGKPWEEVIAKICGEAGLQMRARA